MTEDRDDERPAVAAADPVPLSDPEFKDQLVAVIPHLRAFGRSLSGSRDLADDLAQETLLKAWAARKRFQAGTNMRAWTFIILCFSSSWVIAVSGSVDSSGALSGLGLGD